MTPGPSSSATGSPRGALGGLQAALGGMRLALSNAEVRGHYLRVALVMLVLGLALDAAGIAAAVHWTRPAPDAAWWLTASLLALRVLAIGAVLLATPVVLLFTAQLVLPLWAERIFFGALRVLDPERAAALESAPGLPLWRGIAYAVTRLARFAALTLALLLLALIPLIGPLVAAPLQVYFTARTLSWELLDPYLSARAMPLTEQRDYIRTHHGAVLGFGLPLTLALALPFVGPLLYGLAQAAAAKLLCELEPVSTHPRPPEPA